jgi:hypothetical protein
MRALPVGKLPFLFCPSSVPSAAKLCEKPAFHRLLSRKPSFFAAAADHVCTDGQIQRREKRLLIFKRVVS